MFNSVDQLQKNFFDVLVLEHTSLMSGISYFEDFFDDLILFVSYQRVISMILQIQCNLVETVRIPQKHLFANTQAFLQLISFKKIYKWRFPSGVFLVLTCPPFIETSSDLSPASNNQLSRKTFIANFMCLRIQLYYRCFFLDYL